MQRVRRTIDTAVVARCLVAGVVVSSLAVAQAASAHGRFPEAGMVAIGSNPAQLLVRTTYGLVSSVDGGEQWRWICPEAASFDADKEDPAVVITADGSVALGTLRGLSVSHDGGCDWASVGGELAKRYFVDVVLESDRAHLVALSSKVESVDSFEVRLWQSTDNAKTWSSLGVAPPSDFGALTLAVCPSDPQRIYLSGRDGTVQTQGEGGYRGVILRSDDRAASWQRLVVAGADGVDTLPYIAGVDPTNADRFYVANIKQQQDIPIFFELLLTHDGGKSWQSVLERSQAIGGFAISPDGATVAVGGGQTGLWTAEVADPQFVKVSELPVRCLSWQASGLYACAEEPSKGFSLGLSLDEGVSFEPLMRRASPCSALECSAPSSAASECPARWPQEAQELGAPLSCATGEPQPAPSEPSCDCSQVGAAAQSGRWGSVWAWLGLLGLSVLMCRRGGHLTPE